ncbi:glutamate receptor ionotropic, delta-2-like [Oratosquilla oratoria]|uniref:glutamate receptor ionotropic, delta-2-like n=1 Tax=Oratosquilla oratoria TaxID=337810 RepID=UPI003F7764EF
MNAICDFLGEYYTPFHKAKSVYDKLKLNIQNTQWLWVLQEIEGNSFDEQHSNAQNNITSLGQELMESCVEGTRGLLIRVVSATENKRVAIYVVEEFGNGDRKLSLVAHWSPLRGIRISPRWPHGLWPLPPSTFRGRLIKISYVQKPAVFRLDPGGKLEDAKGYMADLGRLLQERLDFTPKMMFTVGFGSLMSNGTWTGIVGALYRKEAEWGIMDMTSTVTRSAVADFSRFLSWDPIIIMSRAPDFVQNELGLLMVFSVQVWVAVVLLLLVSALMLFILANLHSHMASSSAESPAGLGNYAFIFFAILTYQGDIRWTKTWGWREIGTCGLFVSVLIHALYCGYVTAYLAIPFRSKPIDSLEDLLASDISPVVRSRSATYQFMTDPDSTGIIKELHSRILDYPAKYTSSWEYFQRLHAGELASIDSVSSVLGRAMPYENTGGMCKFYVSKWVVRTNTDVFFYTKNSPLRYRIDNTIKWLCYYGIIEKIRKSHYSVPCARTLIRKELEPLNLGQARAVFYLWFLGIAVSIIVFSIEMLSTQWTS